MTRVLVTGGAGFLGSHLVPTLVDRGDTVIVQDVLAPELAVKLKDYMQKIEYRWKSVADIDAKSLEDIDTVVHLATQGDVPLANSSPRYTYQLNVDAALSLLMAAKETKTRTLVLSTENVYGKVLESRLPATEDELLKPKNTYSATKVAMEALCHAYAHQYNIPIGIIRSGTMFGEKSRPRQVVSIFIRQALSNKPITIEGEGTQTRDFNYVGNTVNGIVSAIDKIKNYHVWNIGSGEEVSIKSLVKQIIELSNSFSCILYEPWRLGEEGRLSISIEKARRELGYKPTISLAEGLKRTIEWTKQNML